MANDYYSLKGFVSYGALTNNDYGEVSPVGELSVYGETFAKDRQEYVTNTTTTPPTAARSVVFSSKKPNGDDAEVPAQLVDFIHQLTNWCYNQALQGTFTSDPTTFSAAFQTEFGSETSDLVTGVMVQGTGLWLPAYLTVFVDSASLFGASIPSGFEEIRIRLWFSDEHFRTQYDEYELEFIAPVDNLDDLFLYPAQVVDRLSQRSLPELTAKVQELSDNKPYTVLLSFNFNYHHLGNPTQKTPAYWTFIVWSEFGNNLDILKKDLAEWILAHSTHTREEWIEIFPDIFATTEFIITPLWNQYAIPNLTLENAMYSPSVKWNDARTFQLTTAAGTGYTQTHVEEHMSFLSMPYKSIACLCLGGPENREGKYQLWDFHPSFLDVPTSSIDFDRMPIQTRVWAVRIFAMLKIAEQMTEQSDLPSGFYRIRRLNSQNQEILYVAANIFDVQYLVVAKKSLNTLHPPVDHTTPPMSVLPDPSTPIILPLGSKVVQLNVSATGGTAPYRYSASSGDIVPGGTIDPDTGYLDVVLQDFGTAHIDVTVTDARNFPLTVTYTIVAEDTGGGAG